MVRLVSKVLQVCPDQVVLAASADSLVNVVPSVHLVPLVNEVPWA